MITAAFPSEITSAEYKRSSRVLDAPQYQRAQARLALYLTLLGFNEERSRIVEHVMSHAVTYGNPDSSMQDVVRELHRFLASRARPHALQYAEDSSVWSSVEWRASAWLARHHETFSDSAEKPPFMLREPQHERQIVNDFSTCSVRPEPRRRVNATFSAESSSHATNQRATRFSSMPPIERRHMVPREIEYISWRGIWRSLIAWLRDKTPQAQLSFGKIPRK